MTLEDEVKPIELRIHHVERIFYDFMTRNKEQVDYFIRSLRTTPECADNYMQIYSQLIEHNAPFVIVGGPDDICAKCSGEMRTPDCEEFDIDEEVENLADKLGDDIEIGKVYTPLEMIERALSYTSRKIEEISKLPARDPEKGMIVFIGKRQANLQLARERLLKLKGESK